MAGTRFAVYATVAIAASVALLAASLVLVPKLTTIATGQPEAKRIVALELKYNYTSGKAAWDVHPVKVGDMQPNSAVQFLSPFSEDMAQFNRDRIDSKSQEVKDAFIQKAEAYSRYSLIRLPEWLGGDNGDISSYRAYSAVAVSNSCLTKYFEYRWAIEEPCHGDRYRPWDGLVFDGPAARGVSGGQIVSTVEPIALPTMTLSVDDEGYIVASKPDAQINGVVDEGRKLTFAELERNSKEMLAAASSYANYSLTFPPTIGSYYYLTALVPSEMPSGAQATGHPVAFMATYLGYFDGRYSRIEAVAYPLAGFPDLALDSSKDPPFNSTALVSLAHFDPGGEEGRVKSGTNIAGQYAYIVIAAGDNLNQRSAVWSKDTVFVIWSSGIMTGD
ncbi:MAG: hypothetical protein ABI348_07140, partial [Nitrososphaera sp.]